MKNTRTRKKCTSDEILEHIDIEADIEKIKNKIPNILSSVQNGDTIVTKYSCNCCGKEDSIEKTIKTENHSHKIVTPTKCRYCNNTFEKNISNITTYWIWRTATINGIPRVVGSKYYIGKEIEHRGMVAFAEEGSVYGFDKGWYENFSPANTYNGLKSEWNETARRHLYLDNSEETLLEWYNTLELKTLFDVCAVYKENNSKATKRVDKRVTLYNELLKKLPPLPEVEFEKKTLPYAIYKEEGYDLCTHSTKISHTCPNCGTYTESSLNYVNRFQHCISCNEDYEIYKSETDALVQTQVEYRMVIDEAEHNGETYIVIRDISAIKKKRVEDSIKYVVHYSYVLSNSAPTFRVTSDNVAMVYHNGIHSYNPVIIRAESLRYSALKEYLGISDSNPGLKNIDRYIKEYQANPVLEQATKAGLSYEYLSCGVFDKNKTNLLDSLRLAKYFYTMFNKLCPLNTETLSRNMCVYRVKIWH